MKIPDLYWLGKSICTRASQEPFPQLNLGVQRREGRIWSLAHFSLSLSLSGQTWTNCPLLVGQQHIWIIFPSPTSWPFDISLHSARMTNFKASLSILDWGQFCPFVPRGHLGMSGDIFECHNQWRAGCNWCPVVEVRDAAEHTVIYSGTVSHTKNYPS